MTAASIPMVLRSRAELGLLPTGAAVLPLEALGATYIMAQEAAWVGPNHFAVGRWDGSLSIFEFTAAETVGPVIAKAVNSPAQEGLQMIAPGRAGCFFTSNDEQSICLWRTEDGSWTDLTLAASLGFNPAFGVANSGVMTSVSGVDHFVAGHANGFVTIWAADTERAAGWIQVADVDVRAEKPVNPWGLVNVRGVAALPVDDAHGYVVAGAEDGNLTVLRVPDGRIMSATLYNPEAKRGINSVATVGTSLLVANCAVGAADSNLWCYMVEPSDWSVRETARANLALRPKAEQVFNFDVVAEAIAGGPTTFFCSTEEGALWMGELELGGGLSLLGSEIVTGQLGSALCIDGGRLALASYDLKEFRLAARRHATPAEGSG